MKKVAVFGGNRCAKDKEEYYLTLAYKTGKLLAESKFVTISGGGAGMMDESMRGASEAGGEVIGILLDKEGNKVFKYGENHQKFNKLGPRQDKLIEISDAYIALPGGIGTLHEIIHILALKRVGEIPHDKPLVLIDPYFNPLTSLFKNVISEGFVDASLESLFQVVTTPEEAISYISQKL